MTVGPTTRYALVGGLIGAGAMYAWARSAKSTPAAAPSAPQQFALVAAELSRMATPLTNYAAGTYASEMYMPAANTVGAWLRASYWLAVGARVTRGRGLTSTPRALLLQAYALRAFSIAATSAGLSVADYATGNLASWLAEALRAVNPFAGISVVASTNADVVAQVFRTAAQETGSDLPQITALLSRLAGTPPRPETTLAQRIAWPSFLPDWYKSWAATVSDTAFLLAGAGAGAAVGAGVEVARKRRRVRRNPERISGSIPAWVPLLIGTGLILFPEPSTTAIGTLIVVGTLGLEASKSL